MTSPRTYRALAVTLRRSPVREADLLSVMYTREHGKLELLARGAQRLTSKLMGHLEPLTLVRVSIARGRSMDQVTEAEVVNAFPAVKNGYENSARGLYVAELVDGFSALAAANSDLFVLAVETLEAIGEAVKADLALRYFDLQLLRLSGFMPELYNCVECGAELEPDRHRFAVGAGGALCTECGPADVVVRATLAPGVETAAFAAPHAIGWSAPRALRSAAAGARSARNAGRNVAVLAGPQGEVSGIFRNR